MFWDWDAIRNKQSHQFIRDKMDVLTQEGTSVCEQTRSVRFLNEIVRWLKIEKKSIE